jgi:hypothetical protein
MVASEGRSEGSGPALQGNLKVVVLSRLAIELQAQRNWLRWQS